MKTLLIILIFPYHIFGQTYSISSTEITDSVVQIFTKKFEFTDNNIIQKLIVQDLMAYELFDSIDCSYMKLLELKSDRELSGFAIDKNDLVEVHFIDYFSVYINENYKKADKGFDMLSDTMRANPLNGQVTWIVNGRGLNNRYFEFSDISSIEFIYNDQTN